MNIFAAGVLVAFFMVEAAEGDYGMAAFNLVFAVLNLLIVWLQRGAS
jgi:hypothetical protein